MVGLAPCASRWWFSDLVCSTIGRSSTAPRLVVRRSGVVWSFLLDVPAIYGLLSVTRFYVC